MAAGAPRRFRFGRSEREARAGATVLEALAPRGWPSLARSVRYHRPRGPFCGVGDCTGCLVRVNGVPNQRACRREVAEGDAVLTENSWPGPSFDLAGALDLLLPRGVDTVHGLRWPAWAAPLYQHIGRRLAGFGRAPDVAAARSPLPGRTIEAEVVVVGAGRAGRAVADALARRGSRPLLIERHRPAGARSREPPSAPGVDRLDGTTAVLLSPPRAEEGPRFTLLASDDVGQGYVLRPRRVVIATGSYDGALLFEGSDRPGVVTADLALAGTGLPLRPIVLVGGGRRALDVLERLGSDIEAVVAFDTISPEVVRAAAEIGVPLYPRSRVVRSVGRTHVRALELARRDGTGSFRLACRSVVLAHRRLPNAQLAFQAGARRRWCDPPGAWVPSVDPLGRTGVAGVVVAGSAAGPGADRNGWADDVAEGVLTATGPAGTAAGSETTAGPSELLAYYRELLRERRRGKWVLCACEDVLLDELEHAVARGYRGMELGMRYTGVGTGLCQGRYCLPEATAILAVLEGRTPAEIGYVTQRPPLVPTAIGTLAGLRHELGPEAAP